MQFPTGRLILFSRAPVVGQVKSRLAAQLGAEAACQVHEQLLATTLAQGFSTSLAPLSCYTTDPAHAWFDPWRQAGLQLLPQQGDDLGQRMAHALQNELESADFAVLFGSDCPGLSARHLQRACGELQAGRDAVIVGAEDGGYVLIGLRSATAQLFENIAWGTDQVLAQTQQRFADLGYDWQLLDTLWDLDTLADYQRWQQRN